MERLSEIAIGIINDLHKERLDYYSEYIPLIDATNRLSAYEDTGLEPDDVISALDMAKIACALHELNTYKNLGSIGDIRKLVTAEKDSRLAVLPCRKGDTLFVLTWDSLSGIEETKCCNISIINREDGPYTKITARCVYDDWGGAVREFFPEDFGRTVFLTRKEAEKALKGGDKSDK